MKRSLVISLIALCLILPSTATAARVKGKLKTTTPSDYKVVLVNRDGSSKVADISSSGSFSIVGKKGASLHLVSTAGRYIGPIVSAKKTKAYGTISGKSGSLGAVTLKSGFATVKYGKSRNIIRSKPSISYDSETGPLGAGKYGLVSSPTSNLSAARVGSRAEQDSIGNDLDGDGLPDLLDIDDDGDLKLDAVDPVEHAQTDLNAEIASTLRLELEDSLNVNIGSVADDEVDTLISDNLFLLMLLQNNSTNQTVSAINVDCGSLSYCSSEGSATISMDDPPITNGSLWTDYDPDADGLPNLYVRENQLPEINLKPHASRSEIGTGDTILFRVTTSSGEQVLPAVLPFVFSTVPAIKEYSSGSGSTTISYPVASNGPGTDSSPISVSSQQVTLTFWKPQRDAVEGAEAPGFIDMGGLYYGVYLSVSGSSEVITCESSDYSNLSETLSVRSNPSGAEVLVDSADDAAVSSDNTLSFTLDIGACLTRASVSPTGKIVMIDLVGTSQSQDQTSQSIFFQLP